MRRVLTSHMIFTPGSMRQSYGEWNRAASFGLSGPDDVLVWWRCWRGGWRRRRRRRAKQQQQSVFVSAHSYTAEKAAEEEATTFVRANNISRGWVSACSINNKSISGLYFGMFQIFYLGLQSKGFKTFFAFRSDLKKALEIDNCWSIMFV